MRARSRFLGLGSGGLALAALAAIAAALGGCEDDNTPLAAFDSGAPAVSQGPLDSGTSNPGFDAGQPGDSGGPTDSGADGAPPDAQAQTSSSSWSATAGLPSAACTPWTLVDTANGHDPVIASGVMTLATDAVAENMYWVQPAAALVSPLPAVLTVEARFKLLAGSATMASRGPANIVVRYGSPLRTVAFYVGSGEAFLNTADLTKGPAAAVATTDGPHTYFIEVDTTTHAVTVKRDTVSILTGTAYVEPDNAAAATIFFGEGSVLATGSSEWTSVTHNAHALTACP